MRAPISAVVSFVVGLVGFGSGCVTVYQFFLEPAKAEARQEGKEEIAAEVVHQLTQAGFNTSAANAALNDGRIGEAVSLATQATLAPLVAVAPSQPFSLQEGEVIDLPSGEMLSFRTVSVGGSNASIRLKVDDTNSIDLRTGDSMPLDNGCRIDYLAIEGVQTPPRIANLRMRC